MGGVFTLERAVGHDLEQRPQRRAGVVDRAVLEVLGAPLLGLGDVLDAIDEGFHVLCLGPEDRLVEDLGGVVKDPAEERPDEFGGDAIAQPAGQDPFALVLEIFHRFEMALADQERRVALLGGQAAPDFGDQQADVVVDPHFGPM